MASREASGRVAHNTIESCNLPRPQSYAPGPPRVFFSLGLTSQGCCCCYWPRRSFSLSAGLLFHSPREDGEKTRELSGSARRVGGETRGETEIESELAAAAARAGTYSLIIRCAGGAVRKCRSRERAHPFRLAQFSETARFSLRLGRGRMSEARISEDYVLRLWVARVWSDNWMCRGRWVMKAWQLSGAHSSAVVV